MGPVVLVVDDDVIDRKYAVRRLSEQFPDARIAATDSVAAAVAVIESRPSLIAASIDLRLQDGTGFDVMVALRGQRPDVEPMVVSGYPLGENISKALRMGVKIFATKPLLRRVAAQYRELVRTGTPEQYCYEPHRVLGADAIDEEVLDAVVEHFCDRADLPPHLRRVLELAARGRDSAMIQRTLGIRESTWWTYRKRILEAGYVLEGYTEFEALVLGLMLATLHTMGSRLYVAECIASRREGRRYMTDPQPPPDDPPEA